MPNDRIGQTFTDADGLEWIAIIPEPNAEAIAEALALERAEATEQ